MAVGVAAEVKSKLSVVDVVGETVQLKKAGTTFKGLCPFHGEKTPSFTVTPARDSWKCFGCGEGGDIFSFVMERDGLTFPRRSRSSPTRPASSSTSGPARGRPQEAPARRPRERDRLLPRGPHRLEDGRARARLPARPRLHRRDHREVPAGLGARRLGHADAPARGEARRPGRTSSSRSGSPAAPAGGAASTTGSASGSSSRSATRTARRSGSAAGSSARRRSDGARPRPEVPQLAGDAAVRQEPDAVPHRQGQGAIRKTGQAVIVEGYTDALMAHQAGFDNVVASLGTALTPGQVALLTRYAKRIALAYDVDAAGEKAGTFGAKALEELIGQLAAADTGVELDDVRVVRLPDGKDPDEVIRETPDRWREEVRTAAADRRLPDRRPRPPGDLKTPGGKARFVDAIVPTLRAIPTRSCATPTSRRSAACPASRSGRVLEVLHRRPDAGRRRPRRARITADAVLAAADALPVDRILAAITPVEEELLRLLLLVPDQQARVADEIGPDQLPRRRPASCSGRSSCSAPRTTMGVRPPFSMSALMAGLDDETAGDRPGDPRQAVAGPGARRVGADHVRRRSVPAPARADEARRARRLGRWRAPRRGGARRPRASVGRARHPSAARTTKPADRVDRQIEQQPSWSRMIDGPTALDAQPATNRRAPHG